MAKIQSKNRPVKERAAAHKRKVDLEEQYTSAVQHANAHDIGYDKLMKTEEAVNWPDITRDTFKRRKRSGAPQGQKTALTPTEEAALVDFIIWARRDERNVPVDRQDIGDTVMVLLSARAERNKSEVGGYEALSAAAKAIMEAGAPGQDFFESFLIRHGEKIAEKRGKVLEKSRSAWSTQQVSDEHGKRLGAALAAKGIVGADGKIVKGREGCLVQTDEMPQPIQRGKKGSSNKVIGAKGRASASAAPTNREVVSVDQAVGLDEHVYGPHFIFKTAGGLTDKMIPGIPEALVSATEGGVQTRITFLARIQNLTDQMNKRGVPQGRVILTDGHPSRFSYEVLVFLRENNTDLYLEPPHTSCIHQMLDQVFRGLHSQYDSFASKAIKKSPSVPLDHKFFCEIMGKAHKAWSEGTDFKNAFAKVGITVEGIDMSVIPKSKLTATAPLESQLLNGPGSPHLQLTPEEGTYTTRGQYEEQM